MSVIPFGFGPAGAEQGSLEDFLDSIPEVEDMDLQQLEEYRQRIGAAIAKLDAAEPKNEASEEYDLWAEQHEDLEDVLDEILDRMDDLT